MLASRIITMSLLFLWTLSCFYAVASGYLGWAFIWILPALAGVFIGLVVRWKEKRS